MEQAHGIINSKRILEIVGHESLSRHHRYGKPITDFFYELNASDGLAARWTAAGFTNLSGEWVLAYSKRTWSYPVLAVKCFWPALNGVHPNRPTAIIEFEEGNASMTVRSGWRFISDEARLGGGAGTNRIDLYITAHLPADYASVKHEYILKLNRCNVEAYIDGILKGVILFGLPEAIPSWQYNSATLPAATGPYSIGSTLTAAHGMSATAMIAHEPSGASLATAFTINLDAFSGNDFLCQDGDPLPPRMYAMYTVDTPTKWEGATVLSGATATSHPIPIWGYPYKTVCFQANKAGTLQVQVYAGSDWRNLGAARAITADTLDAFAITTSHPIVRFVYDPTPAEDAVIAVAEVLMHG